VRGWWGGAPRGAAGWVLQAGTQHTGGPMGRRADLGGRPAVPTQGLREFEPELAFECPMARPRPVQGCQLRPRRGKGSLRRAAFAPRGSPAEQSRRLHLDDIRDTAHEIVRTCTSANKRGAPTGMLWPGKRSGMHGPDYQNNQGPGWNESCNHNLRCLEEHGVCKKHVGSHYAPQRARRFAGKILRCFCARPTHVSSSSLGDWCRRHLAVTG
jgi:hypothetical protein